MGRLIVIDGLDGSGKKTQSQLLEKHLSESGVGVRLVSFPDYDSPSSALVKMYLSGEIAKDPREINAYAASSFYAVDRYVSYKTKWGPFYQNGGTVVADRYTTSNAIHQMSKLPESEWDGFVRWLEEYEYEKLGLPRPDQVLYLNMHPDTSARLLSLRYGNDKTGRDIHEADLAYQNRCRQAALHLAARLNWSVIGCCDGKNPIPVEQVALQILAALG